MKRFHQKEIQTSSRRWKRPDLKDPGATPHNGLSYPSDETGAD